MFKVRDGSGVMMKLRISEEDFEKHGLKDPIKRRAYVQQKAKEVKEDGG